MRILLVEDQPEIRRMTAAYLSERGFAVDAAEDLASARACLEAADYAGVVLDLGLPDGDGAELLTTRPRAGVLVLTARDQVGDRIRGLNSGADDYLVKPFDLGELEARLRAVLRRSGARAARVVRLGGLEFEPATREVRARGEPLALRRRELALLQALLEAPGRLVVRDVLEDRLYSFEEAFTPNALEACASRLRRALDQAGAGVVLESRRGLGYVLRAA